MELKILSEKNDEYSHYSHPKDYVNCRVQIGKPFLPPVRSSARLSIFQSPRKLKKKSTLTPLTTPVVNLPGKKQPVRREPVVKKKVTGKCVVSKIIWKSKDDVNFRKEHGQRKTTWVGCDREPCIGHLPFVQVWF